MKKATQKFLALFLALCLLVPVLASSFTIPISAEALEIDTNVPQNEVVILEQDYEDIENNPVLTKSYHASVDTLNDKVKIEAPENYNGGNAIIFDYTTSDWDYGRVKDFPTGIVHINSPSKEPQVSYIPNRSEGGYTLTVDFCNVTGYKGDEYLWIAVYDDTNSTTGTGFKIPVSQFGAGVWYRLTLVPNKVNGVTVPCTKTKLTGSGAGETENLKNVVYNGIGSGRTHQMAISMWGDVAKTDADEEVLRKAAKFMVDNIKLTAKGYSTYTYTVAEQSYDNIQAGDTTACLGRVTEIVDGGDDYPYGRVVNYDFDSDAIGHDWSKTEDHTFIGGTIYTSGSSKDEVDRLPYVPSEKEGYTVSFNFRTVNEYVNAAGKTVGEYIWFSTHDNDSNDGATDGFRINSKVFEPGVWFKCTVTRYGDGTWVATKTALTGENKGTTTPIEIARADYSLSGSRVRQFCYCFYPVTKGDNSPERQQAHYQIDEISFTTERTDKITATLDGLSASDVPIMAAYDADGYMTAYVQGVVNGDVAEFELTGKLSDFRNAESVKTMIFDSIDSVRPLGRFDEVGDEIWCGNKASSAERSAFSLTADMVPGSSDGYAIFAYTVSNTYDEFAIPTFDEAGNDLLFIGQYTELPAEILYDKALYDYTKEDIVIVINNGTSSKVTILEDVTPPKFTNIVLQLGSDESELNFTFYTISDGTGYVKYAKLSELVSGAMPANAAVAEALRTEGKKLNYYANKATITGLEHGCVYAYQLICGPHESEIYTFETGDGTDAFSFVFAGDPQVGRGWENNSQLLECIEWDHARWGRTLSQIVNSREFEDIDFLMSAGDQTTSNLPNYEQHQLQWDAYTNHDELLGLPTVTVLGNHDKNPYALYPYHTNDPNMLTKEDGSYYCPTYQNGVLLSANYYFTYNNVLFLVLNTNVFDAKNASEEARLNDEADAREHKEFIDRVMEETSGREFDWTIVLYHQSPYGSSYHADYTYKDDGSFNREEQYAYVNIRELLVPILYENGVDLIFSGHDHCYTRSHVIKPETDENGNYIDSSVITPYEDGNYVYADGTTEPKYVTWTDKNGVVYTDLKVSSKPVSVTDPDGIVHVTGATSTGSAVVNVTHENKYAAATATANTRQASRIDITKNSLTIITYNLGDDTTDNITEIDRFTIYHTEKEENTETEISGAQLLLRDDLTLRLNVTLADGDDIGDYTMRFTMNGKVTEVSYGEVYNGKYVFSYEKIAPQMMGDVLKAELIKDGQVVSVVENYSILDNVNYLLANSPTPELEALLLDLLEYGAAAQIFTGYKTNALVNAGKESANTALPGEDDDVRSLTDSTYDGVYCISAGVKFDNVNKIYIKFHADSIDKISAKFDGINAEIVSLGGGEYMAYSYGIFANDFDKTVTFTLCVDGEAVQTVTYSVNAYAYAKYEGNTNMNRLALAMYRYGVSAENYKG